MPLWFQPSLGALAPILAASAAAHRDGRLGAGLGAPAACGGVGVIRRFSDRLSGWVDAPTRDCAEATLAKEGTQFRPEQLVGLADNLADCLNPDGNYSDEDRARRRGITLGWANRAPMACRRCAAG
ncbi:hypothetical protein BST45_19370 [Mycobacterium shinjukuense]|uniref:Uncharacterized protein n=1 Tax=Mycobacterium shinjukuense TaxID=398694 RepID=A0A7I7MU66_9MYCO|nr:DUF222 domain-containing protein [Mycobacterium shinjukuense]ORB62005.1 hypothetical protein BST45_19370 [Mycobacterium shinjukuense]BBX75646.1 hypothetical protein MSHI_35520 [Mycobacterium shinjukuense]